MKMERQTKHVPSLPAIDENKSYPENPDAAAKPLRRMGRSYGSNLSMLDHAAGDKLPRVEQASVRPVLKMKRRFG